MECVASIITMREWRCHNVAHAIRAIDVIRGYLSPPAFFRITSPILELSSATSGPVDYPTRAACASSTTVTYLYTVVTLVIETRVTGEAWTGDIAIECL